MSKQITISPFNVSHKVSSGLKDYIMRNKHPFLTKRMLTRPFSEESFDKNKPDEKERKEILENLQGINLQIKTLSEKVISKDRTKSRVNFHQ